MQSTFLSDQALRKRLSDCETLPSPPHVAERIIELSRDTAAGAKDVAEVIGLDPVLSAKVLKVANSPMYLQRRQIENLSQATVLLGMNAVLNFAMALSFVGSLRKPSEAGLDYQLFWQRSLAAAASARVFCRRMSLGKPENYFLAALLQDIGMLALNELEPGLYHENRSEQLDHRRVTEIEQERFGVDHAAVGAWLLQSWNLPKYIQYAVVGSHDPLKQSAGSEYKNEACCVALSSVTADIWLHENDERLYRETASLAQRLLKMNRQALASSLETIYENLIDTSQLFDVNLGDAEKMKSTLSQVTEVI